MTEAPVTKSLFGKGRLLLPLEAAREIRRTEKTLASWRSLGRGPKWVKLEGRIFYRQSDLEDFIAGEG